MTTAFLPGLLVGLSLIVAIGAQNAFVLRQGLRGEHVLAVCLTCALSDAILIVAGVTGFSRLVELAPWFEPTARYAGAAFLLVYGIVSLRSAFAASGALQPAQAGGRSLRAVLATCLALTWANPHVYLDTVVLLGSISTQYAGDEAMFAAGAITASFTFFFLLGYGARTLRPLFADPRAWRVVECGVGVLMFALALRLVTNA